MWRLFLGFLGLPVFTPDTSLQGAKNEFIVSCWLDQATRKEIESNSLLEECCLLSIEIQIRLDWPLMILTKQTGGWEGSNAKGDCRLQVNTGDIEDAIRRSLGNVDGEYTGIPL